MKKVLLIFIKNPELGKVKTRLAKSIGDSEALHVYKKLLNSTVSVAEKTDAHRQIWYSSYLDNKDGIKPELFGKYLQMGSDLGERMKGAFRRAFDDGADRVVIIGSDCPDLSEAIVENAFEQLQENDLVIGPSEDGGYYLLGMNNLQKELFNDIDWSTEHVLEQTLKKAKNLSLRIACLPEQNDIDTLEDLEKAGWDDRNSN